MQKKYIVRLTDAERETLDRLVKKRRVSAQKVRRAQVLVKADAEGPNWTDAEIAEAFDCRSKTVENIRERFVTEGFKITVDGNPRAFHVWVVGVMVYGAALWEEERFIAGGRAWMPTRWICGGVWWRPTIVRKARRPSWPRDFACRNGRFRGYSGGDARQARLPRSLTEAGRSPRCAASRKNDSSEPSPKRPMPASMSCVTAAA